MEHQLPLSCPEFFFPSRQITNAAGLSYIRDVIEPFFARHFPAGTFITIDRPIYPSINNHSIYVSIVLPLDLSLDLFIYRSILYLSFYHSTTLSLYLFIYRSNHCITLSIVLSIYYIVLSIYYIVLSFYLFIVPYIYIYNDDHMII
jgi:hypothetical protein